MEIPNYVLKAIKEYTKELYPDNLVEQEECAHYEINCYIVCQSLDLSELDGVEKDELIDNLKRKHRSWLIVAAEIEALLAIKNLMDSISGEELHSEILQELEERKLDSNRARRAFIERRIKENRLAQKTRKKIDPIKKLLVELEEIIGDSCYNGSIHNYYRPGELESEGRFFRYPVTFLDEENKCKKWNQTQILRIPSEELMTGRYAFGANNLYIYKALHKILEHLEKNYGFEIPLDYNQET